MSTPAKFMFDTAFDGPSTPPPIAHEDVEALRQAHAAELEQARLEARQQGLEEGRAEAMQSLDRQLSEQLEKFLSERRELQQKIDDSLQKIRAMSLRLALESAQKLAGELIKQRPGEHVESFFQDCLALLPTKAELQLHMKPGLAETLKPRLEAMMARAGQQSSLVIYDDETLSGADCRLLWADGGVEQNGQALLEQIDGIVAAYLEAEQNAVDKQAGND